MSSFTNLCPTCNNVVSVRGDTYWTFRKNISELMELSSVRSIFPRFNFFLLCHWIIWWSVLGEHLRNVSMWYDTNVNKARSLFDFVCHSLWNKTNVKPWWPLQLDRAVARSLLWGVYVFLFHAVLILIAIVFTLILTWIYEYTPPNWA